MNNIVDLIPAFALASGGIAIIAGAAFMWLEHAALGERGLPRLRFPAAAARTNLALVQQNTAQAAPANPGNLQAAA